MICKTRGWKTNKNIDSQLLHINWDKCHIRFVNIKYKYRLEFADGSGIIKYNFNWSFLLNGAHQTMFGQTFISCETFLIYSKNTKWKKCVILNSNRQRAFKAKMNNSCWKMSAANYPLDVQIRYTIYFVSITAIRKFHFQSTTSQKSNPIAIYNFKMLTRFNFLVSNYCEMMLSSMGALSQNSVVC